MATCCATRGRACAWWCLRGWTRRCGCTATGWPGELTEIGASDLAFTVAEAGELLARHGITLTADSLEFLTRRTEGWAAGLRLAAISMGTHPGPDRFVTELVTEDSAVTGYLVQEVLDTQPPEVRDVLLSTSILEQVSAEAASELAGNEQAGRILPALARANGFIQPAGSGWYRYHKLFAEVLRLKLSREQPDRMPLCIGGLPGGMSGTASSPTRCGTPLKRATGSSPPAWSSTHLAIGEIIEPRGGPSLAGEFAAMPHGQAWPAGAAPGLCRGRAGHWPA